MCQLKSEGPRCATHAPTLYLYAKNRCSVYERILADNSTLTPEEQAEFKKLSAQGVLDIKEKNRLSEFQRIQANGSKLSVTEQQNYEKTRASFLKLSRDVDLNAVAGGALSVRQLHAARVDVLRALSRDASFRSRPDHRLITEALADIDGDAESFVKLPRDLENLADELVESGAVAALKPTVKLGNGRIYPVDASRLENLKFLADRYYEVKGHSPVAAEQKQKEAYGIVTRLRVNNPEAFKAVCNLDASEEEIAELPAEYVKFRTSAHFTKVLALAHDYDTRQLAHGLYAAEANHHSSTSYKNNPDRGEYDEYVAALPSVPHVDGAECFWQDETKFETLRKKLSRNEGLLKAGKYAQIIKSYNGMFATTPPTTAVPPLSAPKKNMTRREAEVAAAANLPRGTSPDKKTEAKLRSDLRTGTGGVKPSDEKPRAATKVAPPAKRSPAVVTSTTKAPVGTAAQGLTVEAVPERKLPAPLSLPPLPLPNGIQGSPTKPTSVPVPLTSASPVKDVSEPVVPVSDVPKEKVTEGSITDFLNKLLRPKRKH